MTAAAGGGLIGVGLGAATSIMGLRSENKATISQINREGYVLQSNMRQINQNREQLDRELGDILSASALATAKNMATAKVLMQSSGTVGGTTAQVSKQAYMDQLLYDAEKIKEARNQEIGMLTQAVSMQMGYRMKADAIRSQIKSPLQAALGTLTSAISMGAQGMAIGQSLGQAMPASGGLSDAQVAQVRSSQASQQATSLAHRTPMSDWSGGFNSNYNSSISVGYNSVPLFKNYSPYEL